MDWALSIIEWIRGNEQVLSGIAALAVIIGLFISPFGKGIRALLKGRERPPSVSTATVSPPAGNADTQPAMIRDRPSIAVLPFLNMSDDKEQEFLADGMTEDIITLLASVPGLFVIARNSSFAYKGKWPDVREVARDLGVRYVLEGSIRKAGDRIRVTAQFIDATTGSHLWADKYDRDLERIFDVQDEVTQGIAAALQSRLLTAEVEHVRRQAPDTLDAWGNLVQARVNLYTYRRDAIEEAEQFARRAIEIEPDYAEAHAVLAHILAWRSYNGWTEDNLLDTAREAVRACEVALATAPNDAVVLTDIGIANWHLGRFVKAVPFLERAVALNPNSAMTCAVCGNALDTVGRIEEGIDLIERAFRLSPKDPVDYIFYSYLGMGRYFAGDYEAAKEAAEKSLERNPKFINSQLLMAAIAVRTGRLDEARSRIARIEKTETTSAIDNIFRPRTEGTVWPMFANAVREAMDRKPRV